MTVVTASKYSYLTMTAGARAGTTFLLDPAVECRIGRDPDCAVVLTDPLCSRVHAVLKFVDQHWMVVDADSRNGTFVNDQRADDAVLADGHTVRIGSTEFAFQVSDQPPTVSTDPDADFTQTIVKNLPMFGGSSTGDTGVIALSALRDTDQARQLLVLYQLSLRLLALDHPDEVTQVSLDLLREQTHAAVVGFLWVDEAGRLKPKMVIPETAAEPIRLSQSLTELVCKQGNAVWIARQKADKTTASLSHFADALCVPLVRQGVTVGALHAYLQRGRFRQSDFDFSISLANIMVVALVRARQRASLETDYRRLMAQSSGHSELIGDCPAMTDLKGKIDRVARSTGCVLIRGESGSGKELVARAIHRASPRADRPMLSVNCAAIPSELMESQLFGHKAGSFTSADRDHTGYFQQADCGTLFLDEIGELTWEGQAKLLRILEGHPFLPVGATQQITVDVRVIAATNQDLQSHVQQRKFREDLYYRLTVFDLNVPPLRYRGSDIELLLNYFFDHFRRQHGRPGLSLSNEARQKLLSYSWPGNIRQLRNVIDSAVVLASGSEIEPDDLGLRGSGAGGELDSLRLDHWERKLVAEALRRTAGNVPEAAKLLAIGRATLYRKIEEYGIER
ncbi:MAG TPA: sigma 54-interacting transcriptional regulator [Pirellulales bacterium]|nr:sigma 54-interacting transcriptional regulator [Pirellulales bacterium]